MKIKTVGSVCSGIEAASVAWSPLGMEFSWFSEIEKFPSEILNVKYPNISNLGDMRQIPSLLENKEIDAPDLLCGGTPCQAFSFAGWKNGLNDDRGNLTLEFVKTANTNDDIRVKSGKKPSVIFWENVEGVLRDKTNAFGLFVSSLAGLSEPISIKKWPNAGVIRGPKRNIAWRVLDAKFFGLPQQRRRVYLLAGGKDFNPEDVLFEVNKKPIENYPKSNLDFEKDGEEIQIFREYTDVIYSAYGTKWNGNAAAYNGSLFVAQNKRLRRLSPLECERLMGFPDNYTNIKNAKRTNRYKAIGNSWAVPVIKKIGENLLNHDTIISESLTADYLHHTNISNEAKIWEFNKDIIRFSGIQNINLNCSVVPEEIQISHMKDIISVEVPDKIYISPVGCYGILRRKEERKLNINSKLEEILMNISMEMTPEEIEIRSRKQKRGKFSTEIENKKINKKEKQGQLSLFANLF